MEEKELQQPMSNGEAFFQKLFKKDLFQTLSSMPKIMNKNYDQAKR
jgi:hypothetical protein